MSPEVEHVLEEEEGCNLGRHQPNWGEWHLVCRHAKVAANRMEQVDEREFAGEVSEKDDFGAVPDISIRHRLVGLNLPLSEVRHSVDNEPGYGQSVMCRGIAGKESLTSCSTEVDDL